MNETFHLTQPILYLSPAWEVICSFGSVLYLIVKHLILDQYGFTPQGNHRFPTYCTYGKRAHLMRSWKVLSGKELYLEWVTVDWLDFLYLNHFGVIKCRFKLTGSSLLYSLKKKKLKIHSVLKQTVHNLYLYIIKHFCTNYPPSKKKNKKKHST